MSARTILAAAVMSALAVAPSVVVAHENSTTSTPAAGERVAAVDEVRVDFGVAVTEPALRMLDGGDSTVDGTTRPDGSNGAVFVPDEAVTDAGDYVVQYSAQAVDGHLVIGSFEFTVGGPAAGTTNSAIGVIGTALIAVGLAAGLFWWFRKRNARGQTPPVTT